MKKARVSNSTVFSRNVGKALRRVAKVARKMAQMHHPPIYVWENGKVVAKKP